jgi:uncharacterized protein (TIGR02266 family)
MAYSGASIARQSRENLSSALAALQEDPQIPPDVLAVAQNIAQAIGALFEAERASSEPDGKASVKSALGSVSQTLTLLQEVRAQHKGVQTATEVIAQTLSLLFPLSTQPSRMPPSNASRPPPAVVIPATAPIPAVTYASADLAAGDMTLRDQPKPVEQPRFQTPAVNGSDAKARDVRRENFEVNIGATTESNFFVGFSGEIAEGGVFAATYNIYPKGTKVNALVTLPGGFEKNVLGVVKFVRDPMDMNAESEPGMGVQFESLDSETRELILRFIRKRAPMFYDE